MKKDYIDTISVTLEEKNLDDISNERYINIADHVIKNIYLEILELWNEVRKL